MAAALTLLWSLPSNINPGTPRDLTVWPLALFYACASALCMVYWAIHRFRPSTMWLPGLDAWYRVLPEPAQALVRRAALVPPRFPTQSWRSFPDLSWEVNSAGMAIALFGEQDERPIWRKSTQYIVWYFAPIVVPLCSLFMAPLLQNGILGPDSISDHTKLSYGVSSLIWLTWSITYFAASGTRDFTLPMVNRDARYPDSLASLLRYPNKELRRVASEYFEGKGAATFNLLALAVVPLYMGYIGLYAGNSGHRDAPSGSPSYSGRSVAVHDCDGCCGEIERAPSAAGPASGRGMVSTGGSAGSASAAGSVSAASEITPPAAAGSSTTALRIDSAASIAGPAGPLGAAKAVGEANASRARSANHPSRRGAGSKGCKRH